MASTDLSPYDMVTMRTVTLAKEVITAQVVLALSGFGIPQDKVVTDVIIDEVAHQLVARVRIYFLKGMSSPITKTVQTPLTVWQHFKHQCFPKWLKKFFPVKFEVHAFQVQGPQYLCPHLDQSVGNGPHITFAEMTRKPNMAELLGGRYEAEGR